MLPLALVLAIHALVALVVEKLPSSGAVARGLAIHAGVVAALVVFLTLIWAVTSRGYFWPVWALAGLAIPLAIHALVGWARSRGRVATRDATTM